MMPAAAPGELLAVGASHNTAPLALLERLALDPGGAAGLLGRVASHGVVQEAVVLSTCNRAELYMVASDAARAEEGAKEALAACAAEGCVPPGSLRSFFGAEAVRHLFRVTAGLESIAVGETEIQGQVKRAYERALLEGLTGPITNRLFRSALEAGKRSRSQSGRAPPSLASVGVNLALRRLGELERSRVLVIGAGENAEATGKALARHTVRPVFVASRRYARALGLARSLGGRAVAFHRLRAELVSADLAFSCTSSRQPIVAREELARVMEQRPGRALLLVDTAVPRDIDPAVRGLAGVELYDIDDIKRQAGADGRARPAATIRASALLEEEVARFQAWLASLDVVPAISALRAHAAAAVRQTLDDNEPGWESLSPRDRERVELVARTVVGRLLHEPTMTLRRAAGSEAAGDYVRVVHGLLGLEPPARSASPPARSAARPEATRLSAGAR